MSHEPDSGSPESPSQAAADKLLDLGFLSVAERADAQASPSHKAGDVVSRYRLVALLGEGGFGSVWHAEQSEPIRREVALKVIKPGLGSREIIARFEAERQALALMDHPNIAAVLDAGTTADGQPYFALELVKGEAITTYCDRHRLSIDERLALFIPVCRAVQHAHQKSILHRDLKPSNILVATVDGQPVPKVIDFGIAKALSESASNLPIPVACTQAGVVIGTPRYMSPEQAGSSPDVDTRSDIYSLGVVLCELLTGQSPHPGQPVEFLDALRWIREAEPVKPSTLAQNATPAIGEVAARRGLDTRRLARRLKGDLDWITLKAVEKVRALRYETATALARDLERHLASETVSAVAPTWRYQFGKFARRHRGALTAMSLIIAALVGGTAVSLWQASQAKQSRAEAEYRYAQARDAVDKYLVRVTANPKLRQSNFVDLQRELLETALPFYEDLSRYRGEDAKLRADRAWALGNLADIAQFMGEMEKAEALYRQNISELEKLAAQFPEEPDRQFSLGQRQDGLAQLLNRRGKLEDSLAAHNAAVKTMEALGSRMAGNPHYEYTLAGAFNNRAITLDAMGREQDAVESRNVASAIGEKLVKQFPDVADYWLILATAAGTEAGQLRRQQRYGEEVSARRRAVQCYEAAAKTRADSRDYREYLAITRGALGEALDADRRWTEAEPILRKGVEELQALVDEFPSFIRFRGSLMDCQKELSKNLRAQNKVSEADSLLEQIRLQQERQSQNAKQTPNAPGADQPRPIAAPREGDPVSVAFGELRAGNYAQAVKLAQAFADPSPPDWQKSEAAAEVMAGALLLIQADPKLEDKARQKLASDCAAQAVDCLKRAVAAGFTGLAYFDSLPGAKALQSTAGYQMLVKAPAAPPADSPRRFTFDYPHKDPGPRVWVREGVTWTETQPSGVRNVFAIAGPFVLEGTEGSILIRMNSGQAAFVPNLGAAKPSYLWLRGGDGKWGRFVAMKNVE